MDKLIELVSDELKGEEDDGLSPMNLVTKKLTDELKGEILGCLKVVKITDVCLRGSTYDVSFSGTVDNGSINLEIFKWLVEGVKVFNFSDVFHVKFVLGMFCQLLGRSGEVPHAIDYLNISVENREELASEYRARKHALVMHMFSWLEDKIPIELCSDKHVFISCLESTSIFSVDYFYHLLELMASHSMKLPQGATKDILYFVVERFDVILLERTLQFIEPKELDLTLIFDLLYDLRSLRNPKKITEFSKCLDLLMQKIKDIDQTSKYSISGYHYYSEDGSNVDLNITDHLNLYGWNYPNSPVMNVFNKFVLPKETGNEKHIKHPSLFIMNEYVIEKYLDMHQCVKDPTQYPIMVDQMKKIDNQLRNSLTFKRFQEDWSDAPEINDYLSASTKRYTILA